MKFTRELICSFQDLETLLSKYPRRMVMADRYCPNGEFHYFGHNGKHRTVKLPDYSIWENISEDLGGGFMFPTFQMKRIW